MSRPDVCRMDSGRTAGWRAGCSWRDRSGVVRPGGSRAGGSCWEVVAPGNGGRYRGQRIGRMPIGLMPYERGADNRSRTCGSRTSMSGGSGVEGAGRRDRVVPIGGAGQSGWWEGGRSPTGGCLDGGSGCCGRAGAGRVGRVGPVGGAGLAGDANRMPAGRVWRVAVGRGAGGRSERGQGVGMGL